MLSSQRGGKSGSKSFINMSRTEVDDLDSEDSAHQIAKALLVGGPILDERAIETPVFQACLQGFNLARGRQSLIDDRTSERFFGERQRLMGRGRGQEIGPIEFGRLTMAR